MASGFSFGFSGDDIDVDESESQFQGMDMRAQGQTRLGEEVPGLIGPKRWELEEWLPTLPSQVSYNKMLIPSPNGTNLVLGRREIFDIRAQLMAEDDQGNEELISGLEEGDIKPNFYEGGFKTWECALDLAKLMAGEEGWQATGLNETGNSGERAVHVIELGAGTAMPSLSLFAQLLSFSESRPPRRNVHFTFADYNSAVLGLVTLPNIILTWKLNVRQEAAASERPTVEQEEKEKDEEEELEINPALLELFRTDLRNRGITIDFLSGAWSPDFVELALMHRSLNPGKACRTLIIASETIYSPLSLGAFSETLLALLRRCAATSTGSTSRGLVAAKKVYFGVGGGVDEFLGVLKDMAGEAVDVQQRVEVKTEGVGRVVLQIEVAGGKWQEG